jgi:tetratricopeptide (TPR) repeat protein
LIDGHPAFEAKAYLFCAICLRKINELEKAIDLLAACRRIFANYEEAICLQGRIYLQLLAYKESEAIFRRLTIAHPANGDYFVLLAESFFGQENFNTCIEICDKVIAKFPTHFYDAIIMKIKALIHIGKLDQALLVIQRVTSIAFRRRHRRPERFEIEGDDFWNAGEI